MEYISVLRKSKRLSHSRVLIRARLLGVSVTSVFHKEIFKETRQIDIARFSVPLYLLEKKTH